MNKNYHKVNFKNSKKPNSDFDMVPLRQLLDTHYIDHSPFKLHQVDFFIIILFQEGKGKHTVDFIDYPCKKGSLIVIRKDQIHKFSKSNLDGVLLVFTIEFLGNFYAKTEAQKSLLLFNEFLNSPIVQLSKNQLSIFSQLVDRLNEEYIKSPDHHSPSIIRSELQILITKLYRLKTQNNDVANNKKYLSEFIRFHNCIEDNFSKSLKVKDYSTWLGIPTKTLNAASQNFAQKSAKEFIDEICINHIKRQLINSDKSIKEISYDTGLQETSNFYAYFKKRVGKSPVEYRKEKR